MPQHRETWPNTEAMLEIAGIGAWCLELGGERTSLRWSALTKRIHEVADDYEPHLDDALAFYPTEARALLEPAIAEALRDGRDFDLELPLVTAKGRRIWVHARGRVLARDATTIRLAGTMADITARRLRALETERLTVVVNQMTNGAILTDREGRTEWVNAAFTKLTGYTLDDMAGRKPGQILQGPDTDRAEAARVGAAIRAGEPVEAELLNYHRDGTPYWIAMAITPVRTAAGDISGFIAIESDVTARRRAEAAAAAELQRRAAAETLLRDIIDSLPSAVIAFDRNDQFLLANATYMRFFPMMRPYLVPGVTLQQVHAAQVATGVYRHQIAPDAPDAKKRAFLASMIPSVEAGEGSRIFCNHDGRWLQARDRRSPSGTLIGVRTDITRLKRAEQRSRVRAERDALTGLANRSVLFSRLAQQLRAQRSPDAGFALAIFDIDHFKSINDSLGHDVGDQLLKVVARRLRRSLRAGDTAARLGGDEFAVILPGVVSAQTAQTVIDRLIAAVARPAKIDGRLVPISLSLGTALFPVDADSSEALCRAADAALYEAKRQGRARWALFDASLMQALERKNRLATALSSAISSGRLAIALQPQRRLRDGAHVGFEVLARWDDGVEPVSPADFIPVAEESGLIVPLGSFVLRSALAASRRMLDRGLEPGRMAVNVAAAQILAPDFVAFVRSCCAETGVSPDRLEIEVTETVLLDRSTERIAAVLDELRALGVIIALDDFGTGYASLAHLQRFPVQRLKIDKRFIADAGTKSANALIARTVIGLAQGLRLESVAEGVETAAQAEYLKALGCDIAQGYWIARPLDVDAAIDWLAAVTDSGVAKPNGASAGEPRRRRHADPASTRELMLEVRTA